MKQLRIALGLAVVSLVAAQAYSQTPQPAAQEVYHVHFTKAVPGQSAALGEFLQVPAANAPMPGHFIVLRHQQGDDWDYCVIEHLGPKATVDAAPTAPNPGRDLRAWHSDTFVSGPPWTEFAKQLGLGDASKPGSVYSVAVWRVAAGHRDDLEKALRAADPAPKVPVGHVLLIHLEGGPWQDPAIDRYNSWQDFATDQAASAGGSEWNEVRKHSTYHHDTLADRIAPK